MSTEIALYDEDDDVVDDMGIVTQTTRQVANRRVLNGYYNPDYRTRELRVDIKAYPHMHRQIVDMVEIRGFFIIKTEFSSKFAHITIKKQPGSQVRADNIIHLIMLMQETKLKQLHDQKAIT